jgi:hypothetical protein
MSEDKNSLTYKMAGCGCGCFMLVLLLLTTFFAGAKYGPELIDRMSERFDRLYNSVSGEVSDSGRDINDTFQKANNDAEVVYENINTNEYSN